MELKVAEGSNSEEAASSMHTAPESPSSIVKLSLSNSQTAFSSRPNIEPLEVRLQAIERELLASCYDPNLTMSAVSYTVQ